MTAPSAEQPLRESAPGRRTRFVPDPHSPLGYRVSRTIIWWIYRILFRPVVSGPCKVPQEGPVILAPVHRSFADFGFAGFVTDRKFFFMTKDDLWKHQLLGRYLLYVGAFPVHRESADREALHRAEEVLRLGQVLVLFPEGTRKEGPAVHELFEGAAFLSARTGAPILPMGIGGSDSAMPKGRVIPKPMQIQIVLGEAISAPRPAASGRVSRGAVHRTTLELHDRLQQLYDESLAAWRSRHQVRNTTDA